MSKRTFVILVSLEGVGTCVHIFPLGKHKYYIIFSKIRKNSFFIMLLQPLLGNNKTNVLNIEHGDFRSHQPAPSIHITFFGYIP